jgi:SAM-dependent methyltransferase
MAPDREAYWRSVAYRGPDHPVVRAYALPKLERIHAVLPLGGLRVLDVGCGPGVFTVLLEEFGAQVVGVDTSPSLLARNPARDVRLAEAEALPFEAGSFDVAFEANLLHHLPAPARAVEEMARVARRAIVLIEPNRLNPLMFGFSLLVREERGGLRSSARFLRRLVEATGTAVSHRWTTGMISQNNTPACLLPWLRPFDRVDFALAEYHVLIGQRPAHRPCRDGTP